MDKMKWLVKRRALVSLLLAPALALLVSCLLKGAFPDLYSLAAGVCGCEFSNLPCALGKSLMSKVILNPVLYTFWKKSMEVLRKIDWLKWIILFLPYSIVFAIVKVKFWNMNHVMIDLEATNEEKNKHIRWQGKVILELQERVDVLRLERKHLLETYRLQAAAEREAGQALRRNLSDSELQLAQQDQEPEQIPRPKSEEGPTPVKTRITHKPRSAPREKKSIDRMGKEARIEDEEAKLKEQIRKLRQHKTKSKFVLKKELEEFERKTTPKTKPRDESPKRTEEVNKPLPLKLQKTREENLIKWEGGRRPPHFMSDQVARADCPTKKEAIIGPSSISVPMQECLCKKNQSVEVSLAPAGRALEKANDELVARLEVTGLGRATSYTEVYKKKVHVPCTGKPPEITIELLTKMLPSFMILSQLGKGRREVPRVLSTTNLSTGGRCSRCWSTRASAGRRRSASSTSWSAPPSCRSAISAPSAASPRPTPASPAARATAASPARPRTQRPAVSSGPPDCLSPSTQTYSLLTVIVD